MTLDATDLKKLKSRDLTSEEDRKEVGPKLMDTVEKGGKNGVQASRILIKNNLSYYVRKHEEKLYNALKQTDNFSFMYACSQLVEFIYKNHGVTEKLPDMVLEIISLEDKWLKTRKAYQTDLHRLYNVDEDNLVKICKDEFGEGFEFERVEEDDFNRDDGRRIKLKDSDRRGIVRVEDSFVEFDFYDRIEKKIIDSSIKGVEYLEKSIKIAFGITESVGTEKVKTFKQEFNEVVKKILSFTSELVGDIGRESFKTLIKVNQSITDEQNQTLTENLLKSSQDGFSLDTDDLLLDYILKRNGEVPCKEDVVNVIKKEFSIPETSSFLLNYESNTSKRRAYNALAVIDDITGWKQTLISFGFTDFYYSK